MIIFAKQCLDTNEVFVSFLFLYFLRQFVSRRRLRVAFCPSPKQREEEEAPPLFDAIKDFEARAAGRRRRKKGGRRTAEEAFELGGRSGGIFFPIFCGNAFVVLSLLSRFWKSSEHRHVYPFGTEKECPNCAPREKQKKNNPFWEKGIT